ncbi:hypothetical protein K435DRAFT_663244 [Dendrothele bispora CBS 962.96]|uniref:Macrofage activating glycoprotein n=1 Tax=Dendrothele bispora (strain CBS 962.96) TaxID=1314807 RepID=A0A4S8M547_DENBC|nr:hypothetical protein K435DRAFT_663244 [Dendrothele bispora CBS 962.96]
MVSGLFIALAASSYAAAQSFVSDPLIDKVVPYTAIPYQVDQHTADRGPQHGYNICNSTTEGQSSLCQTGFVNHLDDFCLFAPPELSTIGDTEGIEVAYCTKPGRGTRLIPEGTFKGVQLVKSPGYIQIVGFIDQTKLNIQQGDFGGELDSGGQDGRGNPIGGLVYSNNLPGSSGNDSFVQSRHWTFFIGGDQFCLKVCDSSNPNAGHLCEHIYDRIGCAYNAPNNAQQNVFESCEGEDMMPVGTYVSGGQTLTWTQPPEGVEPVPPYTPTPAASSNCVSFQSESLFAAIASVTASVSESASASTITSTNSNGQPTTITRSVSSSARGSGSGTASAAGAANTNDGVRAMGISIVAGVSGVLLSALMFA